MGRRVLIAATWVGLLCTFGCGGGSNSTTQQIRVVMAAAGAPAIDVWIDGVQSATSVAFRNYMPYVPVKPGQHRVQGIAVSNSASVFDQTVAITASTNLSIYVTGSGSTPQTLVLTDAGGASTNIVSGDGSVRVVNASSSMGPADVYIVNAGTGIAGVTPFQTKLPFNQTTTYKETAIGNYQVFLTAPGTSSVFLDTGPLALTQSQYQTIVAVDGTNGGVNYMLLTDH